MQKRDMQRYGMVYNATLRVWYQMKMGVKMGWVENDVQRQKDK